MDDKRTTIIQATGKLLEDGGPITVDRVAESAGVAKGTIYLYFSSKQDLIRQTLVAGIDDLYGVVDAAARGGGDAAHRRLIEMVGAHYTAAEGGAARIQRLLSDDPGLLGQGGDCLAIDLMAGFRRLEDRYAMELSRGIETGEFREHDPHIVAAALLAMVNNLSAIQLFVQHLDPGRIVPEVLGMVLHGILVAHGSDDKSGEYLRSVET